MSSVSKPNKDKPSAPRLTPRPTAASAARAARNASNRNVAIAQNKLSPTRPIQVTPAKGRSPTYQRLSKPNSKTDIKSCKPVDPVDTEEVFHLTVEDKNSMEAFVVDNPSTVERMVIEHDVVVCAVVEEEHQENMDFGIQEHVMHQVTEPVLEEDSQQAEQHTLDSFEDTLDGQKDANVSQNPRPVTPSTPRVLSRPQTPKAASRPTTPARSKCPKTPSRPNTPLKPTTPSRPNTPMQATRVHTPLHPGSSHIPVPSPTAKCLAPVTLQAQKSDDDNVKVAFINKQRQFHRMKRELDLKQQAVLAMVDCLRELRERMVRDGVPGSHDLSPQEELLVFNVADWAPDELAQLCRDAAASATNDGNVDIIGSIGQIDECALAELDSRIVDLPSRFADLCLQAFSSRQELIDWVKELVGQEDGSGECMEKVNRYNTQGMGLWESLRDLKEQADDSVLAITQISKQAYRERALLLAVGESLVREMAQLRQELETQAAAIADLTSVKADGDLVRELQETRRELEEERSARATAKEKMATTDAQLRQSRNRISKMDRQLREAENSITSLTATVKTLEDQSRHKESQLETRARKLRESLRTGEVASSQLAHQRDALQSEVEELKDQIEKMSSEYKSSVQELKNQLKEATTNLQLQKDVAEKEVELRQSVEAALAKSQSTMEELKSKVNHLELSRPNPELPTEREMDMWAELQATRETLRMAEDEINSCKREKVRFLETLTKITDSDNNAAGMQQKLASELLSKEEIMNKMQSQIRELTKNIKLNEEKVIQYEQYVRDLQAHNRAIANCQMAPDGISYEDLQQEIMNLKMSVLEAEHRNKNLSEILAQKEQQFEQQDKTSRAQARVIKIREELINMLKNKETEQSRELTDLQKDLEQRMKIVDDVNKQIAAKADEIQDLFVTLENKQQQIHRMERIVLALEEQQRRAQAQRTRHEEKIAALEHELAMNRNREKKFLFF